MTADHTTKLLLIDNLDRLRAKLAEASGPLAVYWRNYLDLAASEPIGEFQALPALAWLVTGEAVYARATRKVFLELLAALPLADCSIEAQIHAYTVGAPLARFSIFLDWIWESDILTAEEREQLAGQLTSQVYSHCYLRLKGRLPAGDNQQASMAFACAITGYLFGVKRGASPAAWEMYREGVYRYHAFLASLGAGGWCGEGSTYHHQVLCPVLAIYTAFMEEVTGHAYYDCRIGESTVRQALQLAGQTINSAGMLPGWDEYGNCAPELKTHLAYHARRSGDASRLELIVQHGMWSENELLAWHTDDKVWTLVFWPDSAALPAERAPAASWMNPEVCGKLLSTGGQLELLQIWDHVDAGRPGRAHLNPNSIELCTQGALHTADGRGPALDKTYFEQPDGMNHAAAHSVVIVDHKGYAYPTRPWHGHGERLVDLPTLKALRSDASDLYAEVWGVQGMKRTTLLLGERLVLVHDRIDADAPHHYTWQLMLRPQVEIAGNTARQQLREGPVLDLATTANHAFERREIRDFPRGMEQRCHRLSFDAKLAQGGELAVAMRSLPGTAQVADLSAAWSLRSGGEAIPPELFEATPTLDLRSEAIHPSAGGQSCWFGQRCQLDEAQVAIVSRLTVQRGQVERLAVYVNGHRAPELFTHPSIDPTCRDVQKPDGRFWPSHFDVRGLLVAGENRIAIASSEFRGQTICGPIQFLQELVVPTLPLTLSREGQALVVEDGENRWQIIPDNTAHQELQLGEACLTDAEVAVRLGETLCLGGVTRCQGPELTFKANARVDVEWHDGQLFIDLGEQEQVVIELHHEGRCWHLNCGEPSRTDLPFALVVVRRPRTAVVATPVPAPNVHPAPGQPVALCAYDLGWLAGTTAHRQVDLQAALSADDWRTRIGACQALTPNDREWAQPLLLAMLEAENKLELYAPIQANWPCAKMKTTFLGWPRGDETERAKRRYRLKTVILEALGRIGDERCASAIVGMLGAPGDLYPVAVQACLSAARFRLAEAEPELRKLSTSFERNTRESAIHTVALLNGEISWEAFAKLTLAGPGE